MDLTGTGHRVKILGELQVLSPDGHALTMPADRVMRRILVLLALRAGQPRATGDLVKTLWPGASGFNRDSKSLEAPVSRLRSRLDLPIPQRRGRNFYQLDLARREVDALDFVDAVAKQRPDVDEIGRLLTIWRGDPRVVYEDFPESEWNPLTRAVRRFMDYLVDLTPQQLRQLEPLVSSFKNVLPDLTTEAPSQKAADDRGQRRILIVENEPRVAEMLASILPDHHITTALSLEEAMEVITERLADLDGALVDLHLTERLDYAGLEVLSYIRDRRPGMPRILITASPPPGSQEQIRRTYGIIDIIIKGADGYSASGVRDAVDLMFNDSEGASRVRASARLESVAIRIHRDLLQQTVVARRGIRFGEQASYKDLERFTSRLEAFEQDRKETLRRIEAAGPSEVDGLVSDFSKRWPLGPSAARTDG